MTRRDVPDSIIVVFILANPKDEIVCGFHACEMNSLYVVAVIGAVAGLVTGLGSALIALRVARSQDASARDLQRRQWRADILRDCYSQVGGTHRRLMLTWLDWWDEFNADRKREQHAELMQAVAAFVAACTAVRIYAPDNVVKPLMNLRDLTFKFDEYAETNRDRKRWTESQEAEYERWRTEADNAMPAFIDAARVSIEEVLRDRADRRDLRGSGVS